MTIQKICQSKFFIWLLLSFLTGFSQPVLSAHTVEKSFKRLNQKEKSMLRHFFEIAIKTDQLGHVLFFSTKPACLFIVNTADKGDVFANAWSVWKSKEHLFQHPNFIVYEEVCETMTYVYFINKNTLLSQLSCKDEFLKKLFDESFSIHDLIVKLEKNTFNKLLCKNQVLLGLLLGYGIESSLMIYQCKNLLRMCLEKLCS